MQIISTSIVIGTMLCLQDTASTVVPTGQRPQIHEAGRSPDGRIVFAVDIVDGITGVSPRISFANATLGTRAAAIYKEGSRIAVLGDTSAAQMLTVIDTITGRVIDELCALNASISPSGRWIAYEHFRGRGSPESGAVYAVYDLFLPPSTNRVAGESNGPMDVGVPVYPDPQRQERRWDSPMGGDEHVSMSPIVWTGETVAAVVDRSGFEARLVTISVSPARGNADVRATSLNVASLIDYSRLPTGENGSRYLLAETISAPADDPTSLIVTFRSLPELRVKATRVRVW